MRPEDAPPPSQPQFGTSPFSQPGAMQSQPMVGMQPPLAGMQTGFSGAPAGDLDSRKLFVRGLSYDTTAGTIHSVFSKFGQLEECDVCVDKNTGRSK